MRTVSHLHAGSIARFHVARSFGLLLLLLTFILKFTLSPKSSFVFLYFTSSAVSRPGINLHIRFLRQVKIFLQICGSSFIVDKDEIPDTDPLLLQTVSSNVLTTHLTDDPIPINPIFARSVWKLSKIHRPDGFIEDKGEFAAV